MKVYLSRYIKDLISRNIHCVKLGLISLREDAGNCNARSLHELGGRPRKFVGRISDAKVQR